MKTYVKIETTLPSIFVGMISFDDFVEDDEKQAEVSSSEDEPQPDPDPVEVKDEPVEDLESQEGLHISLKVEPDGSNIDDERGNDVEMEIDDFDDVDNDFPDFSEPEEVDDRPTYEPYDPETTHYSMFCFLFVCFDTRCNF